MGETEEYLGQLRQFSLEACVLGSTGVDREAVLGIKNESTWDECEGIRHCSSDLQRLQFFP